MIYICKLLFSLFPRKTQGTRLQTGPYPADRVAHPTFRIESFVLILFLTAP